MCYRNTSSCNVYSPVGGNRPSWTNFCRFLNMSWLVMNTYGMAVDSDLGKLYMADYVKTGKFTGKSTDYSGRIRRANLDGTGAEVRKKIKILLTGYLPCTSSILHDSTCSCVCLSTFTTCVVFCSRAYHLDDGHQSHRSVYV